MLINYTCTNTYKCNPCHFICGRDDWNLQVNGAGAFWSIPVQEIHLSTSHSWTVPHLSTSRSCVGIQANKARVEVMSSDFAITVTKIRTSEHCIILCLHYIITTCQSLAGEHAHSPSAFSCLCLGSMSKARSPLTFTRGKLSLVESVNLPILEVYIQERWWRWCCVFVYTQTCIPPSVM